MKVPVSWLRDLVALPEGAATADLAQRLTSAGLTVERVEQIGGEVSGPVVIGRVLSRQPEEQKNGKTVNWCRVDVGPEWVDQEHPKNKQEGVDGRGIICGAHNFDAGDLVVVALPGAVLPGGFEISARKTYGHYSDGMICSAMELGLGEDHDGIIVVDPSRAGAVPGADALEVLAARAEVLEVDVTTDLGHCLSMRGLAREAAQAFDVCFTDPYRAAADQDARQQGWSVRLDSDACPRFVALTVEGIDPTAPTPEWMVRHLEQAGMRSLGLVVDITNHVMLESGQPLHAYDADKLQGTIVVRKAHEGETLVTLDDQTRTLAPDDLLITDDSGPIGLAGVMGGASTEVGQQTSAVVIEAAHFEATTIGRAMRRHKLFSEASRRFDRGVDPALPLTAARKAAQLMAELGGGTVTDKLTVAGELPTMPRQELRSDLPEKLLGFPISREKVISILQASGVAVTAMGDSLTVVPPTWRADLVDPYDYVEEVACKLGYDQIPVATPPTHVGAGLAPALRARRDVLAAAVAAGFVEQITLPFVSVEQIERLGVVADDPRHDLVQLANALDDTHSHLRSTLLPGLFAAVARNTSRSNDDLALFECGRVFIGGQRPAAPRPSVAQRPSDDELGAMAASLPDQPRLLAAVVSGAWQPATWSGDQWQSTPAPASWTHVVALAETCARAVGVTLQRRQAQVAPWHPGRCAELLVNGEVIGCAGELHPDVIEAFDLPARTAAVEFDVHALIAAAPGAGTIAPLSPFPVAKEDVALIVDASVPSEDVRLALAEGAGELLESVRLFDIYTGPQVGEGKKSLAFAMRFRGTSTLTDKDAAAARDAAVAVAVERFGAVLRA